MRRAETRTMPSPAEQRNDLLLWVAILLGPVAMGINTIVGYTVAHWTTDTNQKHFSYLVSLIDLALCIAGALLGLSLYRHYSAADESVPENGRRLFMSKAALSLSVITFLLILGQTLAVLIIKPAD
jgi:MFS family permease